MTREEALEILDTIPTIGEQVDALEMAIEALEAEQKNERDLISRQAVLEVLQKLYIKFPLAAERWVIRDCTERINELPSFDLKYGDSVLYAYAYNEGKRKAGPNSGEWLDSHGKPSTAATSLYCSECGEWSEVRSRFCMNCGARMDEIKEGIK